MGSSNKKSSRPSHAIIVDERPYRSASKSSHSTMSSHGSYSGLGTNSDSYGHSSYSPPVTNHIYRSSKSVKGDYTVNTSDRGQVSVHNHGSSGYDQSAPHPTYESNRDKKDSSHKKPSSR
ncbi:hypothetical protein F4820DRAFT_443269 [Hypoxylon rubiginosum]|uniref:Uncharacterized protein n=1 Tax=Hypoxylon rubiginosum TaxID=110542 RepID=A0ACB9ZF57_9PEZI|nr:hypothetical protein F4820DRAFT_443269 [Hypoxylon rubiginosum]